MVISVKGQPSMALEIPQSSDDSITVYHWDSRAKIIRSTGDGRAPRFLYQETVVEILSQIKEGEVFAVKDLQTGKWVGPNEMSLFKSWLDIYGLIRKVPGGYIIDNIKKVKETWNRVVMEGVTFKIEND